MKAEHLFPYKWNLADGYPATGIEPHGLKVFGTFICGGGSSMGYKLAGFHHLGGVEIDPKIATIYEDNHDPEYLFVEDLRVFNQREDLPAELYNLDVLDGSPPCSTFSMAGDRERAWGKEKIFAEGQALQTLDDLVFVYCETIKKLRPKVFLLENVKGLALGNARSYPRRIFTTLDTAGYDCQIFVLNAASMGVPQVRERCYIIGRRKDLNLPKLNLSFKERPVYFGQVLDKTDTRCTMSPSMLEAFKRLRPEDRKLSHTNMREFAKTSGFTLPWANANRVCPTLTTGSTFLQAFPRELNEKELCQISTFPLDYKCPNPTRLRWLSGMSVPPVMMAQIAHQIYLQLFSK